jgi:serine protease Do
MFGKIQQYLNHRRIGGMSVTVLAIAFLLVGFGMASAFHRSGFPATKNVGSNSSAVQSTNPAMPASFSELATKLSPTVVNVKVTKMERVAGFPEGPFGDFFKNLPEGMPQQPESRPIQGTGSGVIINNEGYILTNNHVVEGAKEVTVTLADKKEYPARIIGRDPKTDLAVLKIEAKETLAVATLGDSEQLKVGDWVLAIGNPFGLSHTVTSGIVSAKGRVIGAGPYDDFIQTDASINPGNSGGPLFNMQGEVVGINTAIIPYGQGIGFAIPVNMARSLVPQLIVKGEVTRGYMGVSIQPLTPELAKAMKLGERPGALVGEVVPGSPADKAGIQRGDVIIAYNKKPVEGPHDLSLMVAETPVGEKIPITILRDGKEHQLSAKVEKLGTEEAKLEDPGLPNQGKWGIQLKDRHLQMADPLGRKPEQGVLVVGIQPLSPADRAGIHPGDVVLEINRQPVNSVKQAQEALSKAKEKNSLLLLVARDKGSFYVALEA